MSTLKIDGGWITLDDRRVARLVNDLPHWLMVDLRDHEGSPEARHDEGYETAGRDYNLGYDEGYGEGFAAGRADVEVETESRRKEYGDD